jgi:hypothetical protein
MKKIDYSKVILLLAVVLFLFLGTGNTVLGYGDGGSGDGGSDASSSAPASTRVTPLSDDEVTEIFSILDAESRETMTNVFSGTNLTARELMSIRQTLLEQQQQSAHARSTIVHGLTLTVEGLDWAGQQTQTVLSYVPGVGWVTAGLLDAARGGANAYRDGKSAGEILKDATIAGVTSVTINKLSPLNADKTFNNARGAWNILTRGSGKHAGKAGKVFLKNGVKYLAKKEAEAQAGSALGSAIENSTKQAPHRETPPIHTLPGVTYHEMPTKVKVFH